MSRPEDQFREILLQLRRIDRRLTALEDLTLKVSRTLPAADRSPTVEMETAERTSNLEAMLPAGPLERDRPAASAANGREATEPEEVKHEEVAKPPPLPPIVGSPGSRQDQPNVRERPHYADLPLEAGASHSSAEPVESVTGHSERGAPPPVIPQRAYMTEAPDADQPEKGSARVTREGSLSGMVADDREAETGKWLYLGAAIVLIVGSLVLLTGYSISRGWITPPIQFALVWAVSIGFIATGLWAERKNTDIGQSIAGLGSIGCSLAAVAGATTFHLYGDNTALGLVLAVAAINLLYGDRRSQVGLAVLGVAGGLIASIAAHDRYLVSVGTALVYAGSGGYVGWHRRWSWLIAASFAGGLAALCASLKIPLGDGWRVVENLAPFGMLSLGFIPATIHRWEVGKSVPLIMFATILAVATPYHPPISEPLRELPTVGVALGLIGIAVAIRRLLQRDERLYIDCGFGAFALLWVATRFPAQYLANIYWGEAAVLLVGLFRKEWRLPTYLLSIALFAMMIWVRVGQNDLSRPLANEWLTALSAAGLFGIYLWISPSLPLLREDDREKLDFFASFVAIGAFAAWVLWRTAQVADVTAPTPIFGGTGLLLFLIGVVTRRRGIRYAGWTGFATALGTVLFHDLSEVDPPLRIAILMLLGLVALGIAAWYAKRVASVTSKS